jgi:hypothetical protein
VQVAWDEAVEALTGAGHPRQAAETPHEFAGRAAPVAFRLPPGGRAVDGVERAPDALQALAGHATSAGFSPEGASPTVADEAEAAAGVVVRVLAALTPRRRRLGRAVDPRTLRDPDTDRETIHVG